MSDVFAEATAVVTPKLSRSFVKDLNTLLDDAMKKVKQPTIRVMPGLERGFMGNLRKQVNAAVDQAQKGVKPIVIRTVVETPSRRALQELLSAPVNLGAVAGAVTTAAPTVGGPTAHEQEVINRLTKGRVALLGLEAAAEDKVGKAIGQTTKKRKDSLTTEERQVKVKKLTAAAQDILNNLETKALTVSSGLNRERRKLALTEQALGKLTEAATIAPKGSGALRAQLNEARRIQADLAQGIRELEQTSAAGSRAAAGGLTQVQRDRRASGLSSLKTVVTGLNATDDAASKLTTTTKDLAAAQDLLRRRSLLLIEANKGVKTAAKSESDTLKVATRNAQLRAQAAVDASRTQVAAIQEVQKAEAAAAKQTTRLQQQQAAIRQRAARASAASASAERRRSEQLSRGGQASLLSLAGIRGATLAASRSFLVGAATITVFARAVKQFADLERNLHVFAATTSATAEQMEAVRREATLLGADLTLPAVSAGDAAGAMVELAKAGLTVQDSIDGARAVLELGTAAAIDNADAVRLVANVLNAFSLAGRDATKVADTLANAANAAQGSIVDIGTAFQQAATAGHQVGLSFQDTATFLTILAKNGIRGSDAGTSLRTALIRLVNPSKDAKEAFEKLGIVLRDAQGNIRPDVFLQIADATRRLGPAQRDATIALIGGQDAFRAVTILGRQSVDSFLAMRAALREEGTAAELAKARTEGLHGAMDGLQSVLETVGTNLARHVGPGLAGFVHEISNSITALSQSDQVARTLNQTLEATATSFDVLGKAISTTLSVALPLVNVMSQVVTAIGVTTILAGVVAWKALSAVFDGVILRLKVLKPLFATVATAQAGAAISDRIVHGFQEVTAAQSFFVSSSKSTQQAVETTANKTTAAMAKAAKSTSAFRVALSGVSSAALAAATSGTALTIGIAAAAAAIFFLATRETAAERATRKLREETDKLAGSFDRVEQAATDLGNADRAAQRGVTGLQQAQLNLRNAQAELGQSTAGPASAERKQLLLSVRIAQQDLTFATQDYKKSLDDLAKAQEANLAAEENQRRERTDARKTLRSLIDETIDLGRAGDRFTKDLKFRGISGETLARRQLIATLREQATAESVSEEASERAIATRKRLIALIIQNTQIPLEKLAPDLTKIFASENLDSALRNTARLFGVRGKEAVDAFVKNVQDGLGTGLNLGQAIKDALNKAKEDSRPAAEAAGAATADFYEHGFAGRFANVVAPKITATIVAGLTGATKLALAELKGVSDQGLLEIAQNTLRVATSVRQRAEAKFKADPTKANKEFLERAIAAEQAAAADVARITGDIEQSQKDAADAVKDAQEKADTEGKKIVDSILEGRRATLLQRKITSAGLTDWLGDDKKTTQAFLDFLKKQKVNLLKRLKAAGASKKLITETMQAISDLIFQTTNSLKKINQDIADNVASLKDIALQKIDLRIRIAQAREDVAAEIRLRRQRLAIITRELVKLKNAGKKNTLAWLELKAQQAEEIAAIRDLTAQEKERKNAAAEFGFQFLQAQSGFVTNLLGNLIPGSVGGLVGGSAVGSGLPQAGTGGVPGLSTGIGSGPVGQRGRFPEGQPRTGLPGAVAEGVKKAGDIKSATGGPTRGGQAKELHLLNQILVVLRDIRRGTTHTSAQNRRGRDKATMEIAGEP